MGRIHALQLDYTDAYTKLMQSSRKVPQNTAMGFQRAAQKLVIIVQVWWLADASGVAVGGGTLDGGRDGAPFVFAAWLRGGSSWCASVSVAAFCVLLLVLPLPPGWRRWCCWM